MTTTHAVYAVLASFLFGTLFGRAIAAAVWREVKRLAKQPVRRVRRRRSARRTTYRRTPSRQAVWSDVFGKGEHLPAGWKPVDVDAHRAQFDAALKSKRGRG